MIENGEYGGESGLGNVLAQMGVLGFISLAIFRFLLKRFQELYYRSGNSEYFAIFVVTANWLLIYFLSAASLGFTGNVVFFVFIGLMLNKWIFKENLQ